MSKAEKFIELNTKTCSNINLATGLMGCDSFAPWLTTDQARRAVEIAREETIEKVCEWLEPKIWSMFLGDQKATDEYINDFKQAIKDE